MSNAKLPVELYLRDKFCSLFRELRLEGLGTFYFVKDKKTGKEFHQGKKGIFYKIKNTRDENLIITSQGENSYVAKENLWNNFSNHFKKRSKKKKMFNDSDKEKFPLKQGKVISNLDHTFY